MSLAKNVAAFIILADGLPIIYAGQEQHYAGGNDPANREATWFSGYSTTSEIYKLIASSNAIRNHAISTDSGYLTYKVCICYEDTGR
jgi:alpha-amylase